MGQAPFPASLWKVLSGVLRRMDSIVSVVTSHQQASGRGVTQSALLISFVFSALSPVRGTNRWPRVLRHQGVNAHSKSDSGG